jgi:hypothetical protein
MQATPSVGAAAPALFGIIILLIWLLAIGLAIAAFVFWIVALVDCVRRDFPGPNDKVVWVLVIVFAHTLGAIIYWFAGRPRGTLPSAPIQTA